MKKKILQEKWAECMKNCASCITINDYQNAERLMEEGIKHLEDMRVEHTYYSNPIDNFGVLNKLVKENFAELQGNFPAFINDWVSLIKEDKNLRAQYLMYEGLEAFDKGCDETKFITESIDIALGTMNKQTIKESNLKAFELLKKHELILPNVLDEAEEKYYDSCQYLLENEKNNLTLVEHARSTKAAAAYIKECADNKVNAALTAMNESVNSLTADEYRVIEAALGGEELQRSLFEDMKAACIKNVEDAIGDDKDSDEEAIQRLNTIKEALSKMEYKAESFKNDIMKLIELKEI